MSHLKTHLFICTNTKENGCAQKGSEELHSQVKKACSQKPYSKEIRINKSGCLGQCEKGIVAVLYPQNQWYFEKTKDDADFFVNEIENKFKD